MTDQLNEQLFSSSSVHGLVHKYDEHKYDVHKYPRSRVELHLHLDGAVRVHTIAELASAKHIKITQHNTEEELAAALAIEKPQNLAHFLSKIRLFKPLLVGDTRVHERIAYELCQDQASQHVAYFEVRFSPHFLANTVEHDYVSETFAPGHEKAVTPADAVIAVSRGLARGEADFSLKARIILSTIKGFKGWAADTVRLAVELKDYGVVGIDIAGVECDFTEEEKQAFERAVQLGIHRTVHAGEGGPAAHVHDAVTQLAAERIGHGYRVLDDRQIYQMCRDKRIHFETCPYSSILTGAVSPEQKHPIVTFAEDNINFSISTDDPTVTKSTLDLEYQMAQLKGLNEANLVRANFNAARSCFLSDKEKQDLLAHLYKVYGFIE